MMKITVTKFGLLSLASLCLLAGLMFSWRDAEEYPPSFATVLALD